MVLVLLTRCWYLLFIRVEMRMLVAYVPLVVLVLSSIRLSPAHRGASRGTQCSDCLWERGTRARLQLTNRTRVNTKNGQLFI